MTVHFPTVVITRFAYLGKSGWQIPPEEQAKIIFDPTRLRDRLDLFRDIAVASLGQQTERDFIHYILTSAQLPEWARAELDDICRAAYGPDRYFIDVRKPALARRFVAHFLAEMFDDRPVAQVVLDDDDGLSADFMETMKAKARVHLSQDDAPLPFFLSWPTGYGCVFRYLVRPELYEHNYRFINLGLTLIAKPQQKNILAIDHRNAPRRFGANVFAGQPMFVRGLHDHNDSRVAVTDRWKAIVDWPNDEDIRERFAFMLKYAQRC
jgi:hypothetical protein